MNYINPLNILLFLVSILLIVFVQLNQKEHLYDEVKQSYEETSTLVDKTKRLKQIYKNKQVIVKKFERILQSSVLSNATIEKKKTYAGLKINIANMNKRSLEFLLSKVLNGSYKITSLEVKKLSSEKASLKMEIQW